MSQRVAFIIAAGLTAFILVLGGAIVGQLSRLPDTDIAGTQSVETDITEDLSSEMGAEIQQATAMSPEIKILLDREVAYQQLIKDANDRLQSIYAGPQSDLSPSRVVLDPVDAATIALNASPSEIMIELPNLVNFQGVTAYKITLEHGMVYVNANTGEIIYTSVSTAPPVMLPSPPPFFASNTTSDKNIRMDNPGGKDGDRDSGGGENEHEHEGGDD